MLRHGRRNTPQRRQQTANHYVSSAPAWDSVYVRGTRNKTKNLRIGKAVDTLPPIFLEVPSWFEPVYLFKKHLKCHLSHADTLRSLCTGCWLTGLHPSVDSWRQRAENAAPRLPHGEIDGSRAKWGSSRNGGEGKVRRGAGVKWREAKMKQFHRYLNELPPMCSPEYPMKVICCFGASFQRLLLHSTSQRGIVTIKRKVSLHQLPFLNLIWAFGSKNRSFFVFFPLTSSFSVVGSRKSPCRMSPLFHA